MSKNDQTEDEFDPKEFCMRHLKASAWMNERSQPNYKTNELLDLVSLAIEQFKRDSSLSQLSAPCLIVGDIHGQFRDLIRILHFSNDRRDNQRQLGLATRRFMFLGDYVDRGPHSVECISLLFCLKILYPSQYILLRGNHETKLINYVYGFREELMTKLGKRDGVEVWERFNDAFSWMPIAGLVGNKILCMHGGISPHLTSLDDIRQIRRPLVEVNNSMLALDLLWSDPLDDRCVKSIETTPQYLKNELRGLSCTFNEAAVTEMCQRLRIDLIVRAHQVMDNGFKFFANRKLVTIFSAPRYMNESNNKGAVLKVSINGSIAIITMKSKRGSKESIPKKMESKPQLQPPSQSPSQYQSQSPSLSLQPLSPSSENYGKRRKSKEVIKENE